jgi:hypothetical protein
VCQDSCDAELAYIFRTIEYEIDIEENAITVGGHPVTQLIDILHDWKENVTTSNMILIPRCLAMTLEDLGDDYTRKNRNIKNGLSDLGGSDVARAGALEKACSATGCSLFLSTISLEPSKLEEHRWDIILDGTDGSCVADGMTSDDTAFMEWLQWRMDVIGDLAHVS